MEEKEVVGSVVQTWQNPSFPIMERLANSAATTMDMAVVEPEDGEEKTAFEGSQYPDVAVIVACPLGAGKSDLVNICEGKKYFWRPAILPGVVYTSGRQPYIYEVFEEYLGLPGEAVASLSSWPELWRHSEPQPTDLRGVFPTNYPRKVLFSKPVTFKTSELPRWKPKNIIGLRTFEEEDA